MAVPHKFNKGDVVKLNSDDKLMTVVEYVIDNTLPVMNVLLSKEEAASVSKISRVLCEWIYEGKKAEGTFSEESLELVSGDTVY